MIDKEQVEKSANGIIPDYHGSEVFPAGPYEVPDLSPLLEVDVHIHIEEESLDMTIWYIHDGIILQSHIDDWHWTCPDEPDADALYYLALALPSSVLGRLLMVNPSILEKYIDTVTDGENYLTIIHNCDTNDYVTIYKRGPVYTVVESYGVSHVPTSLLPLARHTGMSVIGDQPDPLKLMNWRGGLSPSDVSFV